MNIEAELERLTQPPFSASKVKHLSPREILRLQLSGAVAPVSSIPEQHLAPLEYAEFRIGRCKGWTEARGKFKWRG